VCVCVCGGGGGGFSHPVRLWLYDRLSASLYKVLLMGNRQAGVVSSGPNGNQWTIH